MKLLLVTCFFLSVLAVPGSGQTTCVMREFGTSELDNALGVARDGTGIYVVGKTLGTFPGKTNNGPGDAFVRKYNIGSAGGNVGGESWTRQFGTTDSVSPGRSPDDNAT